MDNALRGLLLAHGLFVLSGAAYSAYWVLQEHAPGPAALLFFLVSLVSGFSAASGAFLFVIAAPTEEVSGRLRPRHVVLACLALLAATFAITTFGMGRPFTSELVFVMIWAATELCALLVAFRRGWLSRRSAAACVALVAAALAVGLVCYAIYFELVGAARFYSGLVPYGAVALAMLAVGALLGTGPGRR